MRGTLRYKGFTPLLSHFRPFGMLEREHMIIIPSPNTSRRDPDLVSFLWFYIFHEASQLRQPLYNAVNVFPLNVED